MTLQDARSIGEGQWAASFAKATAARVAVGSSSRQSEMTLPSFYLSVLASITHKAKGVGAKN